MSVVLVILAVLVAYCLWALSRDYRLSVATPIDASAEEVWAVLTDTASYPDWNPFIVESTGDLTPGGTITITTVDVNGESMSFNPRLLAVDPERELRWIGTVGVRGFFDGEHSFRIEPGPGDGVTLVQEEWFSGVAVPPMINSVRSSTEPMFEQMNLALAEEVIARRA